MTVEIADHTKENFIEQISQLKEAGSLTKKDQSRKLASTLDVMISKDEGIQLVYEHIGQIVEAGFFADTHWNDPAILNSSLVSGTLKSGGLNTVYEVTSELRLLAIAKGTMKSKRMTKDAAGSFLEEMLVSNLDLLFPDASEELRKLDEQTRNSIGQLFSYLRKHFIRWERISKRLAIELEMLCSQRPVITDRTQSIIRTIRQQLSGDETAGKLDLRLQMYVDALYSPSELSRTISIDEYAAMLQSPVDKEILEKECKSLGRSLRKTGLSSSYHALLLRRVKDNPTLISLLLGLDGYGKAELKKYSENIRAYIDFGCHPNTCRMVYGLAMMLERNLLSRQPVESGLERLKEIELHAEVRKSILGSNSNSTCTAEQHLFADTVCVLGQPLGVGQGWNPTCQSARGISLWSRHAPGKLLSMIHSAAVSNYLEMRFEGAKALKSSELSLGLAKEFDYNLDVVSIVLVPHLDRLYFEMIRLASGRGEDPHKWVNPAMYGHWIPTGFSSPYNYLTNSITNYKHFMRLFYFTHHPNYNGGHDLTYPNPVGIFLTAANGKMLGFHAVSILRVAKFKETWRIYFLNPNNEGRQKWQSDIQPTVAGNGEEPGESSLPFYQFASRIYAFHFKPTDARDKDDVKIDEIEKVTEIARNSWGESYIWQEAPKPFAIPSLV